MLGNKAVSLRRYDLNRRVAMLERMAAESFDDDGEYIAPNVSRDQFISDFVSNALRAVPPNSLRRLAAALSYQP